MTTDSTLQQEADAVAGRLFGARPRARKRFTARLLNTCAQAAGKDVLVIHNPGGWGCSPLERCLEWERSIVQGVKTTVEDLGYRSLLIQYFRSTDSLWSHARDLVEQVRMVIRGTASRARVLAAELKLITRHLDNLQVVMVGVSQGAAFSNAVMRQLGEGYRVYSIELGTPFVHVPWRIVTPRVLAIDGNGVAPDPVVHRDLWIGTRIYATAPMRWLGYRLIGKPRSFGRCIDFPGHDYNWKYPSVRQSIENYLATNLGRKKDGTAK